MHWFLYMPQKLYEKDKICSKKSKKSIFHKNKSTEYFEVLMG